MDTAIQAERAKAKTGTFTTVELKELKIRVHTAYRLITFYKRVCIIRRMSWVKDGLERERQKAEAVVPTPPKPPATLSPNQELWRQIGESIDRNVHEFNMGRRRAFDISHMDGGKIIQLIPKQVPMDTLKLELSNDGSIKLVTTISKPGVPRLAKFRMKDGTVVFDGELTGAPKPPETPMNVDEFVEDVLKPFLFPEQ